MAILSAVSAWYSGYSMLNSCFFERIQLRDEDDQPIVGTMRGYGFFAREIEQGEEADYSNCIAYSEAEMQNSFDDGFWDTGRTFAIISMIFGSIGTLIVLATMCVAFHLHMFEKLLLWIYLLAAICQGFAFFAFGTDFCREHICRVGIGSGYAITAFFMLLVCANTVKSFPEALPPKSFDDDDSDSEYESDDDWLNDDDDDYDNYKDDTGGGNLHKRGNKNENDDDSDDDDTGTRNSKQDGKKRDLLDDGTSNNGSEDFTNDHSSKEMDEDSVDDEMSYLTSVSGYTRESKKTLGSRATEASRSILGSIRGDSSVASSVRNERGQLA